MRSFNFSFLIHVLLVACLSCFYDFSFESVSVEPIELTDLIQAIKKIPKKGSASQPNISRPKSAAPDQLTPSSSSSTQSDSSNTEGASNGFEESIADEFEASALPILVNEIRVPYPPEARASGIQGAVQFDLLISSRGKVVEAVPVGTPPIVLMNAARKAVMQFVFNPAVLNDQPVAIRIRYTYRFVIQ